MRAMSEAIEDAAAFRDFMGKATRLEKINDAQVNAQLREYKAAHGPADPGTEPTTPRFDGENRMQRRARERAEKKASQRAEKATR